jgi:hypothetical protein
LNQVIASLRLTLQSNEVADEYENLVSFNAKQKIVLGKYNRLVSKQLNKNKDLKKKKQKK